MRQGEESGPGPEDREGATRELRQGVDRARGLVEEHFPGLWPAVEVGLSVCATVLLADNSNPVAVIYEGPASGGKTTVINMFSSHPLCYRSDNFTPAAFVSHAANRTMTDLGKTDLLPRIRHRVLVTPELAPIFRGKETDLTRTFSTLTRVMDGQGYVTDSGTHGQRGYKGDYMFAWLGGTTPFEDPVWRLMAQLGSRLFFLTMEAQQDTSEDALVASVKGLSYQERVRECQRVVADVLNELIAPHRGKCPEAHPDCPARAVQWPAGADPETVVRGIARWARLVAALRSIPVREGDEDRGRSSYAPAQDEAPQRAFAVLRNLAGGHALLMERRQLAVEDLPPVARVALSSVGRTASRVLRGMIARGVAALSAKDVQGLLGARHHETARRVMEDLGQRDVFTYVAGSPIQLCLAEEWTWLVAREFRTLLAGNVSEEGLCGDVTSLPTSTLEGEKEGESSTQPPPGDIEQGCVADGASDEPVDQREVSRG